MRNIAIITLLLEISFILCLPNAVHGQSVDLLKNRIYKNMADSLRISTLADINNQLIKMPKDSAVNIWEELITHCQEKKLYTETGICYYNLGKLLNNEGDYYTSYKAYQKSLTNYGKTNFKSGIARTHNGLGIVLKTLNKYEESLEHYKKSAKLFKEMHDTKSEGLVYLNIGALFLKTDSIKHAKEFLIRSHRILKKDKSTSLLNCYINLGEVYNKELKFDTAQLYYTNAYTLSKNYGVSDDKFQAAYHLGKFLYEQNKLKSAEEYLKQSSLALQDMHIFKNVPIDAKANFQKVLSNFYALKGDTNKAFVHLKNYYSYEATLKVKNANIEINQRDLNKLENITKRRDIIILVILVGLCFSILFLFSVYRSYKHKQKANQLLTEMDELKTQLYSNISHELRTPLTLILGPLEQMLASEAQKKPSRHQIKLMRKNANSILKLVNQMLELSKIDAKSLKLKLSESDIVKFLKVRFASFTSLAEHKNISFNSYLPHDKKIRFFDDAKLEKIVNNLLSNAIKFTPNGGQVFCFASFPKKNQLELTIQDTGPGIAEEELNLIFDRFHQVKGSYANNNVGTGIGLSLTKELVELMHGRIAVESVLGEGTKFKIQLPLGKEHLGKNEYIIVEKENTYTNTLKTKLESDESSGECTNHSESENGNKLPTILVVDDHNEISEFIKENLTPCYYVETAENGVIGLNKAIENIPDLIISDLMMPEMDGIEMSSKLKLDERTSHIPIIILTAKSKIDDKLQGLETGADAFLAKPFSMKELNLRVRKLIEQRKKLRERFTSNLSLEPKDIAITSADEKFLNRLMEIIEENIGNSEFEVRQLQEKMLMSRMQLFRKIKALTNQTPGDFIRTIRLKRGASLIEQNFGNIAQITYEVGFNNPSYFAKCFKDLFGILPSEYTKRS